MLCDKNKKRATWPLGRVIDTYLVMLCDNNKKRATWPLGRVTEIFPGDGNVVRIVRVKTKNETYFCVIQRSAVRRTSTTQSPTSALRPIQL